jgi:hypothetical protein
VPRAIPVLGTDGFGRSDTRELRGSSSRWTAIYVAVAALKALADEGEAAAQEGHEAIQPSTASTRKRRIREGVTHRFPTQRPPQANSAMHVAAPDETFQQPTWRNAIEVKVPDIGDFKDIPVIECW